MCSVISYVNFLAVQKVQSPRLIKTKRLIPRSTFQVRAGFLKNRRCHTDLQSTKPNTFSFHKGNTQKRWIFVNDSSTALWLHVSWRRWTKSLTLCIRCENNDPQQSRFSNFFCFRKPDGTQAYLTSRDKWTVPAESRWQCPCGVFNNQSHFCGHPALWEVTNQTKNTTRFCFHNWKAHLTHTPESYMLFQPHPTEAANHIQRTLGLNTGEKCGILTSYLNVSEPQLSHGKFNNVYLMGLL